MKTAVLRTIICFLFGCLATESICMADTEYEATLLHAITESLSLDKEGNLCYSKLESGSRSKGQACPSDVYEYYDSTYCISKANSKSRVFFDTEFSEHATDIYDDPWFSFIEEYDLLSTTVEQLLEKLYDIAERLEILRSNRQELLIQFRRYRDESFLEPIDNDIRRLSSHGIKLRSVARPFFSTIKPRVIDAEIEKKLLEARAEGMRGLTSFERELQGVASAPDEVVDQSLKQIFSDVERAVAELERAIAE